MEVKDISEITPEVFESKNKETDYGAVGNDILYDMCRKYPNHNDKSEIIAKVWIIGRSYAVSIERGEEEKRVLKTEDSEAFFEGVSNIFIEKKFDELLEISTSDSLEEKIPYILKTHKNIMKLIHEHITGDDKRSFVSKYLHFHFRNLFFIYDSRVAGLLKEKGGFLKSKFGYKRKEYKDILNNQDYDKEYAKFFVKCFFLQNYLKELNLTPRELDSCLIKIANDIERNK